MRSRGVSVAVAGIFGFRDSADPCAGAPGREDRHVYRNHEGNGSRMLIGGKDTHRLPPSAPRRLSLRSDPLAARDVSPAGLFLQAEKPALEGNERFHHSASTL